MPLASIVSQEAKTEKYISTIQILAVKSNRMQHMVIHLSCPYSDFILGWEVLDISVSVDNAKFASVGGDKAVYLSPRCLFLM
jgi:hypothetical protein